MDSTADRCALLGADGLIDETNLAWDRDGRSGDPLGLQSARIGSYVAPPPPPPLPATAAPAPCTRSCAACSAVRSTASASTSSARPRWRRAAETTATLERTVNREAVDGPILVSFASQSDAASRPTAVRRPASVPAGTTLGRLVPALNSIAAHAAILDEARPASSR